MEQIRKEWKNDWSGFNEMFPDDQEKEIADWWLQKMSEQEARHQEVLEEIATKIETRKIEYFGDTSHKDNYDIQNDTLSDAASIVRSYKK